MEDRRVRARTVLSRPSDEAMRLISPGDGSHLSHAHPDVVLASLCSATGASADDDIADISVHLLKLIVEFTPTRKQTMRAAGTSFTACSYA